MYLDIQGFSVVSTRTNATRTRCITLRTEDWNGTYVILEITRWLKMGRHAAGTVFEKVLMFGTSRPGTQSASCLVKPWCFLGLVEVSIRHCYCMVWTSSGCEDCSTEARSNGQQRLQLGTSDVVSVAISPISSL